MKIGELSEILNMKPETIRYYEKEGIISPSRKKDSTFREYSIWDFLDLCDCRIYRQMDFGIKDVKRLMKTESLEGICKALSEKHKEVLEEANQKMILATEVKSLNDRISNAPLNIGNYWFKMEEEKVGILFVKRDGKNHSNLDVKNPYLQEWLKRAFFLKGCMHLSLEDILNGRDHNEWFFSTSLSNFRMLHLPEEGSIHVPGQIYLHTVIDIGGRGNLQLKMLEPVLEHVKQKGLEIEPHIIGEVLTRCYEGQTCHCYLEIMVPIKK